jgi:hypothetical protein
MGCLPGWLSAEAAVPQIAAELLQHRISAALGNSRTLDPEQRGRQLSIVTQTGTDKNTQSSVDHGPASGEGLALLDPQGGLAITILPPPRGTAIAVIQDFGRNRRSTLQM